MGANPCFTKAYVHYPLAQLLRAMATPRGLEPLTSAVTGLRSTLLNYEAI